MIAVLFALLFVGSVFMVSPRHYDLYITYRKYWSIAGVLLLILSFSIGVRKNKGEIELPVDVFLKTVLFSGVLEAVYALAQFFKIIPSFNRFYAYTGSFDNPAIFAMLLSFCVPIAVYYAILTTKKTKGAKTTFALWTVALLLLIFIGFSESRTGLIATVASSFIVALTMSDSLRSKLLNKRTILILIPLALVLLILLYKFKADSANGRLLMWRVSLDMIKDKPLLGFGINGFSANYLQYQADFFTRNPESSFLLLADNVNNPFNEYLLVLINYGLFGFLLLSLFIIQLFRKLLSLPYEYKKILISLTIAIMIWSFFSYPFSMKFIWLLTVVIVMIAFSETICNHYVVSTSVLTVICIIGLMIGTYFFFWEREWKIIYERTLIGDTESVLPDYKRLHDRLKHNDKFLYNYGAELHYSEHYEEGLQIMKECSLKNNDYDVQMIMGDCYKHIGDTLKAMECFDCAGRMVPSKFLPQYNRMHLFVDRGDTVNALNTANEILSKDVKVYRSKRVQRIISDAEEVINKLTESATAE